MRVLVTEDEPRVAAAVARGLRPGAALLEPTTRHINEAIEAGTPVLARATHLGPQLESTLNQLGKLSRDPSTLISVNALTHVVTSLQPTLTTILPMQVNCDYLGVWGRNASSAISEGDENGTWFRFVPVTQPSEMFGSATPAPDLHDTIYGKVDGECETGNEGYAAGQVIGGAPGNQPKSQANLTTIPAGIPPGPGADR